MPSLNTPEARAYRLLQRTILICASLAIAVEVLFMLFALDKSSQRCDDVQAIRSYVLESTSRSIIATPTLDYYKTHQEELRDVMGNLYKQRDAFVKPLDCSLL